MTTNIVIIAYSLMLAHAQQDWAHFKNCSFMPGGIYCGDYPSTFEADMPSIGRCMLTCRDHSACAGVSYNPVQKICKGYNKQYDGVGCAWQRDTNYYVQAQEYIGCYLDDSGSRAMGPEFIRSNSTDDNDSCSNFCRENSNSNVYFGTQNGIDCFCGGPHSTFNKYGRVNDTECNTACSGNPSQTCGGVLRNSVHRIFDLF